MNEQELIIECLRRDVRNQKQEIELLRLSLRDHFAMAALTGLLANPERPHGPPQFSVNVAYELADVMLERRNANSQGAI